MINIAEILKYCPQGMKLYSPICGDCTLECVSSDEEYPIEVVPCLNNDIQLFTIEGKFLTGQAGDECLLFPSKNQRDWSKFRIPVKRGDIMMEIDGNYPFIASGEVTENGFPKCVCGIDIYNELLKGSSNCWTSNFYIPASEDVKEKLFKAIDDAGCKWDGENLVKKEHQFKPFDKVLVRDSDDDLWAAAFYSHRENCTYPHVTCGSMLFRQCIPFEGNEYLVGTANSPK